MRKYFTTQKVYLMKERWLKSISTRQILLYIIAIVVSFAGCNKELAITQKEQVPVSFSALKFEGNITRITDNDWDNGDEIGVYVHKNNAELSESSIIGNYANYVYTTSGNGRFYSKNDDIYYPEDKALMDIVAYYPYNDQVANLVVPIDVTEQKEFLYSNNLKGLTKPVKGESISHTFNFSRVLSNLVLNISSTTTGASLEGLSVTVSGAATKGSFSLSDASLSIDKASIEAFNLKTSGSESAKELSAFFLPTDETEELELTFKIGSQKLYTWKVPHKLERGKKYSYNIKLNRTETEVATQSGYMEIPVYSNGTTAPNSIQALHMVESKTWLSDEFTYGDEPIRNYTALFDTENRVPYWIAFPLHPIYMKSGNRTDDWAYDPKIPEQYQPNLTSGWKTNGLDRGHLMASADRSATRALNSTTFYFSNMAPQNSTFNQGNWESLESKVRTWSHDVEKYDTLYVVTGVVLPEIPSKFEYALDVDGNKSVIPEYFYKALLRKDKKTNKFSSIAFYMENDNSKVPYKDRVISVSQLEEKTGFTFFPNLPASESSQIKSNSSLSPHWN